MTAIRPRTAPSAPARAVDIITILPSLMTFTITMIGDSFPILSSQTAFLDTLQARQPRSLRPTPHGARDATAPTSRGLHPGRLAPRSQPLLTPASTTRPRTHGTARTQARMRCAPASHPRRARTSAPSRHLRGTRHVAFGTRTLPHPFSPPQPRAAAPTAIDALARAPQAFNFLRVVRLIKVKHLLLR